MYDFIFYLDFTCIVCNRFIHLIPFSRTDGDILSCIVTRWSTAPKAMGLSLPRKKIAWVLLTPSDKSATRTDLFDRKNHYPQTVSRVPANFSLYLLSFPRFLSTVNYSLTPSTEKIFIWYIIHWSDTVNFFCFHPLLFCLVVLVSRTRHLIS